MTIDKQLQPDFKASKEFLDLLGKNGDARFRAFPHKHTAPETKKKLSARKFGGKGSSDLVLKAQHDGLGIYLVINKGGDTKDSIEACIAYFAEFDGTDEADQQQRVSESGLPEPSIIVRTGGGSLHFYWLLAEPVANKALWQGDMKRLAAHLGSDKSVNDPSRVMRLPGCFYMGPDQKPLAMVETIHIGEGRYVREDITNALPSDPTPLLSQPAKPTLKDPTDRTGDRALDQLQQIPSRVPGSNTREDYLRLLWGLAHIFGPDMAGIVMATHSPAWAAEEDLSAKAREANGAITDGTFFEVAKSVWGITSPKFDDPGAQPSGVAQGEDSEDLELQREALERFQQAQASTVDLIEVFGPIWGQRLIDRAAAFPCDPSMLLLPMLGYIASLVGTKAKVRVKGGWSEPMVIWGLIAQPASSLKSPAGGVFGKPLAKLQGQSSRDFTKRLDTHKIKEKKWKADCKTLEADARKKKETPELPEPPDSPLPPRHYYVETVTIERVAGIHAQRNVPGLIAFHDELADWFASLDKKQQNDRPRWLKLWTGQAIKHDTATSVNAFAEHTAISIVGFIQPDKLAALHNAEGHGDTDTAGDGLWSRFLPVIPRTLPFTFNDLEVDLTDDLIQLANQLETLPTDTVVTIARPALEEVFTPAWEKWSRMEAETSGSRAAFIGKLRGYSVRIAGLLHLLNTFIGEIDMATANTSINLCEFFLAQFDQLAPQISNSEDVNTPTAKFLQKVKDKDASSVRVRDLQRWKTLGKKATAEECRLFLQGLANQDIGTFEQVHTKGSQKGAWEWHPTVTR